MVKSPLSVEEKKRYDYLMEKIRKYGADSLNRDEIIELKNLLNKKEDLDEGLKLLLMFALGMLMGYILSKA
ncbi:MAG: hypothetical protein QXN92_07685 [Archaeoglobaceae archaeon]